MFRLQFLIVFALVSESRYIDWIERDTTVYNGDYVYFEFKGSKIKHTELLTIQFTESGLSIRYTLDQKNSEEIKVLLDRNEFECRFKNLKETARLVKRMPPPNAKGPIEFGILIGNKFFVKTEND